MSSPTFDSVPRIDYAVIAQIRQLESVRPGLAKHLVEVFERNAKQFFANIPGCLAANDMETLRIGFHSMKGTAGSLGAQRLSHIAGIAERAAVGDSAAGPVDVIAKQLRDEFETVCIELARAAM
jgi:HPt (histidine-containing phosphotransfer) domain-containing protein